MQSIFIVEDDDNIRDMLAYALRSSGFEAQGFASAEPFWRALSCGVPTLALLDIMLPGEDGIAILRRLKQSPAYRKLPVIMLTAKGAEYERIRGLDGGADDYITKPFSVMEVISRIRAVLRRCGGEEDEPQQIGIGGVAINAAKRSVLSFGQAVSLTYKEFELLHCLMRNEGIVLTRDRLLEQIWGYDYSGESRTVDMHIKALRQKLGRGGELIKTVRNVGYKMEG